MDDYLERRDQKSLRPVVHVFSHVCYSWRRIVDEEPLLWTTVYAPPTQIWKYHEYNLIASSARKSKRPLTLLVNVYQGGLGHDFTRRFEKDDSIALTVSVQEERSIFQGEPYTLHVKMANDNIVGMQQMSRLPFHSATSVILQSERDISSGHIFRYVSYKAVKSLTIISPLAIFLPDIDIEDIIPQIISLNLSIRNLPANMFLEGYLPPALEELHIRHEDRATFPVLLAGIELPELRILGLSYGSMGLLEAADAAELRTLILYGSSQPTEMLRIEKNNNADQNYKRVTELEFREWGVVEVGSTNSGTASFLQQLAWKLTALHSIKFTDSFVDGEFLVTVMDNVRKSQGGDSLKALQEVTLSNVTGITRSQCDMLANLVPKLNIYV
jgi:hypothetical protein